MHDTASILPLSVTDLCYATAGKLLINRIGFSLPRGGITALLGPNGAGKSLTLRLCHGLIAPTAGTIRWTHAPPGARKRHAMVFQRPVLLRRSVHSNIVHALKAAGFADGRRRADATLARFGMSGLADRPARLLSGGEQQRLAIARAWSLEPELLFMDEPSAQLDPGATRQIEQIIADLVKDGVTIVLATHDLGQARRLASRVLFLDRGQLLEDNSVECFFTRPFSPEGRRFIAGDLVW
jgi:tungstate transport system ATP-binding protein